MSDQKLSKFKLVLVLTMRSANPYSFVYHLFYEFYGVLGITEKNNDATVQNGRTIIIVCAMTQS